MKNLLDWLWVLWLVALLVPGVFIAALVIGSVLGIGLLLAALSRS